MIKFSDKIPANIGCSTVQGSVPIVGIYEKYNLIESYEGVYSKSYVIADNNYLTAPVDEQHSIYDAWKHLINSFSTDIDFAVTFNNHSINMADYLDAVLLKEKGDGFDHLRKQLNKIISDRMSLGKNGVVKDKILTLAIHSQNARSASEDFDRIEREFNKDLQKIGSEAKVVPLANRLNMLYGIYNNSAEALGEINYNHMRSMGISINDLIAPTSMDIYKDYMSFGKKYVRTLRVTVLPSQMNDEFINNATDMPFDCLTTMNFKPLSPKQADVIVAKNLTLVRDEKARQIKSGQKQGIYDDSFVRPDLLDREAEALALRDDIHQKDEHLFETTLSVTIFAESKEKLEEYTQTLIMEYKKASVTLSIMEEQQEEGFNSTLPLAFNQIIEKRTLKSSSAAIFIPFSTLEINDPNGINYSCNLISKNLLVYDRLTSNNFNGFILGTPGSGKSFSAKLEMLYVFLKHDADIVVIDPEDEYTALANLLGGEIIKITPGGEYHINPLDITVSDDESEHPVNAKSDFILKLMECITKSPFGINSIQETIIDESVHQLFAKWESMGSLKDIPEEEMPTLTDLQVLLASRQEPEARELTMALKLYSGTGSLNAFGQRTNVKTHSRFVVYQIRDVGDRLKNLAMLTILDHIWNQIVDNRKIGKNTWFYVDEIYLLFQNEYSAAFLNQLFRRARKYGGVPTGITQNVTPLLESPTARDMLQNCCFIEILAQAGPDRERLRELLNLSSTEIDYITSSPKGQGLLYTGKNVVPFYSSFPKDNDVYRALTSDLKEIQAIKAAGY